MTATFSCTGAQTLTPKGHMSPNMIYSAEQIHEWTFLHWNYYMLEFTKTPMTATFSCTGAQTVAPKGHMSPNWFIQPNRYMNEPFCIETITRWSSQKHHDSNFSCTGAQAVAPKDHMSLTDLFSRTDTWMNLFALKLLHVGVHKNTNDSNFLLYRGPDSSPKGP